MHRVFLASVEMLGPLALAGAVALVLAGVRIRRATPAAAPAPGKALPPPPDVPAPRPTRILMASWYGEDHRGRLTASGVPFDPGALTCAHPYLPFGTRLRLSLQDRTVEVTVNDRGPFIGGRDLDLSLAAAERLGMVDAGVALVNVEVLP